MKKLFCLMFLLPLFAAAQKIITHTVGPKESLSSIGRLYNINGRELANYNKIDYDKGLSLGQVLKIPPKNANTEAPVTPAPVKPVTEVKAANVISEKSNAIYHTVEKKQTLYAVSKLYNVTIAEIKKWNNLTADGLSEGSKIIVGYSKVNNLPAPVKEKIKTDESKVIAADTKKTVKASEEEMKKEPVAIPAAPKKQETVVALPEKIKTANFGTGFFKTDYEAQIKGNSVVIENGTGGIFKSTSGWEDGKYYCLHNTAIAGSILKITNTATGKTVYAKVLDLIPDINQNNGLIVRISNAAANALGAVENKLECTINYSK